jgi:hypothetical protein
MYNNKKRNIMSTSRSFRLTDELVEKYKPYTPSSEETNDNFINQIEIEILVKCMSDNNDCDVKEIFNYIKGRLWMYRACVEHAAEYDIYRWYKEDEDNILTIYGYHEQYCGHEIDDETNDIVEELVLTAKLVNAGDYFDSESHFFDLKNEIKDKLDYIRGVYFDNKLTDIMDEFKKYELTDDDFNEYGELKETKNKIDAEYDGVLFDSLD